MKFSSHFCCRYEEKTIIDLLSRYERPESKNRWDSPLFTLSIGTRQDSRTFDEVPVTNDLIHPGPRLVDLPVDQIFSCLIQVSI